MRICNENLATSCITSASPRPLPPNKQLYQVEISALTPSPTIMPAPRQVETKHFHLASFSITSYFYMNFVIQNLLYNGNPMFDEKLYFFLWLGFRKSTFKLLISLVRRQSGSLPYHLVVLIL